MDQNKFGDSLSDIGIVPPTLQQQTQAYLGSIEGISDPHSLKVVFGSANDLQAALENPAVYGLTNVTDPCFTGFSVCSNPNQYLFWDDHHPTSRGYQLLANAAANAIPEPTGIALVGIGIAAIGWARRRG